MEEPFKDIEKFTKKWIQEAGVEKPSANFLSNVMQSIKKDSVAIVYRPLISKNGWWIIGLLCLVIGVSIFVIPGGSGTGLALSGLKEHLPLVENPLADFQFSKISAYAIGFLALFFVQIPFLRGYMERRI